MNLAKHSRVPESTHCLTFASWPLRRRHSPLQLVVIVGEPDCSPQHSQAWLAGGLRGLRYVTGIKGKQWVLKDTRTFWYVFLIWTQEAAENNGLLVAWRWKIVEPFFSLPPVPHRQIPGPLVLSVVFDLDTRFWVLPPEASTDASFLPKMITVFDQPDPQIPQPPAPVVLKKMQCRSSHSGTPCHTSERRGQLFGSESCM